MAYIIADVPNDLTIELTLSAKAREVIIVVLAGNGEGLWRKTNSYKRKSREQVMRMSSWRYK